MGGGRENKGGVQKFGFQNRQRCISIHYLTLLKYSSLVNPNSLYPLRASFFMESPRILEKMKPKF